MYKKYEIIRLLKISKHKPLQICEIMRQKITNNQADQKELFNSTLLFVF